VSVFILYLSTELALNIQSVPVLSGVIESGAILLTAIWSHCWR